ncbi:MAG: hypothetical protein M3P96_10910 [Actinomycetota bacterium]|nr:hypothetical protein [Actinomycetota bacterium]
MISALDRSCGGSWWQSLYLSAPDSATAAQWIAREFVQRISDDAGGQGWAAPVRNREDNQPLYYLVFFTRHLHGAWLFGDSLASAQKEWRRTLSPPPLHDDGALFQLADTFPEEEKARERAHIDTLKVNLLDTRARVGEFVVGEEWRSVYGDVYGIANDSQVRRAVKQLHSEGRTASTGVGDRTMRDHKFLF